MNTNKALHATIHRILPKQYSDYRIGSGFSTDYVWEKLLHSDSNNYFRLITESIILKKVAQVARFRRFEAAWILCFPPLLGVVLLGFSFLRCLIPAHHTVCDRVVYQYMTWYVMEWSMSLDPTQRGNLPLQRGRYRRKKQKISRPFVAAFDETYRFEQL